MRNLSFLKKLSWGFGTLVLIISFQNCQDLGLQQKLRFTASESMQAEITNPVAPLPDVEIAEPAIETTQIVEVEEPQVKAPEVQEPERPKKQPASTRTSYLPAWCNVTDFNGNSVSGPLNVDPATHMNRYDLTSSVRYVLQCDALCRQFQSANGLRAGSNHCNYGIYYSELQRVPVEFRCTGPESYRGRNDQNGHLADPDNYYGCSWIL